MGVEDLDTSAMGTGGRERSLEKLGERERGREGVRKKRKLLT